MIRQLARIVLTLTGFFLLIFGIVIIGPTGVKQHFMNSMMYPNGKKMHSDLSVAMKLDAEASTALENALRALMTLIGVSMIYSLGFGSTAVGISLLALAASLHRPPRAKIE